ncbi:GLPGLI family protein [Albibacterium profundi]|uniref:GLPGLI family protein n=1 Tax=Albibacterium profundi TaxID=3134906 RepID=A0ABV5CD11_9SPHI
MRFFLLLLSFLVTFSVQSQNTDSVVKVSYYRSSNGKLLQNQDPIILYTSSSQTAIASEAIINGKGARPFERFFVDRANNSYIKQAFLQNGKQIVMSDPDLLSKHTFTITEEKKEILGYECTKAVTSVNSNTIELWFTNDLRVKGAPTELGQNLGLVLEMVRNGNYAVTAQEIEYIDKMPESLQLPNIENSVDDLSYKDLLWKSRFVNLSIFDNEQINFIADPKSDSVLRFANGTIILKKVKIPHIENGNSIFVELVEKSNGDAYDRTGTVFMIPTDNGISFLDGLKKGASALPIYENGNGKKYQGVVRTDQYTPLVELMRFFTPFGVKQFNHIQLKGKNWQDSVSYRHDVTEFAPLLTDREAWIGVFIGNYDGGGHIVSLDLTIHPGRPDDSQSQQIVPLFNTLNVMEMAGQEYATMFDVEKGLEVKFTLQKDMKNAKLRFITTGHGGWGNGDEFVPKENTIYLDGSEAFSFTPWRTDCGSYRLYNPASGNFSNGLSSSDLSRSNWCPGTLTSPIFINLGDLNAGEHTVRVQIPQGAPEGTSFSSWNVSGVLIGE